MAVAATQQNDLQVNIGVGLEKLTRQLAAAEARMVQAARRSEQGFTRANTRIATDFRRVTQATDDLADSAGRVSGGNGLRQVALQLSQVGQQAAVTGNFVGALAIQLPDLLLAFGTAGALIGAAAAVLTPFAMGLFQTGEAAAEAADKLANIGSALGTMRGDVADLADLTERYVQAINASADATDLATQRNVANIGRELEARRAILRAQVATLRLDINDAQKALENLEQQRRGALANRLEQVETFQNPTPQFTRDMVAPFAPPSLGLGTATEGPANDPRTILQINNVTAQLELMRIAAEEGAAALDGVFTGGGGASAGGGTGGGGGGGGGSRPSRGTTLDPGFLDAVAQRVTALSTATAQLDQANQAVRSSAEQAFTALITGAKDAQGAAADLLAELGKLAASAAFRSFLGGMGGSPIISAIFGGGPSFAGGGFTGMGARAGGIDGKGGFPAVLHPNERVVDYTKGGGGMAVKVEVNIDARGAGDSGRGAMGAVDPLKRAVVAAVRDAQRRGY